MARASSGPGGRDARRTGLTAFAGGGDDRPPGDRGGGVGTVVRGAHHENFDDLAAMGADVVRDRVVDGDLLSAGGVTSGLDLALHLVERSAGGEVADRVAADIE